jgi:hypothetical protein
MYLVDCLRKMCEAASAPSVKRGRLMFPNRERRALSEDSVQALIHAIPKHIHDNCYPMWAAILLCATEYYAGCGHARAVGTSSTVRHLCVCLLGQTGVHYTGFIGMFNWLARCLVWFVF